MDVVHAWASGSPFSQLCKMTDTFEGSIIRCIRRLEELLRQMCQAAKAIGNAELEKKFEEGNSLLAVKCGGNISFSGYHYQCILYDVYTIR